MVMYAYSKIVSEIKQEIDLPGSGETRYMREVCANNLSSLVVPKCRYDDGKNR